MKPILSRGRLESSRPTASLNGNPRARSSADAQIYFIDTAWLCRLQSILTPTEDEELALVTGIRAGFITVPLLHYLPKYASVSVCGIDSDIDSTSAILREMERSGHELVATLHSHPGRGPGAITPSQTDINLQRGLEAGGYRAVMGIVSRGERSFFARFLTFHPADVRLFGLAQAIGPNLFEVFRAC